MEAGNNEPIIPEVTDRKRSNIGSYNGTEGLKSASEHGSAGSMSLSTRSGGSASPSLTSEEVADINSGGKLSEKSRKFDSTDLTLTMNEALHINDVEETDDAVFYDPNDSAMSVDSSPKLTDTSTNNDTTLESDLSGEVSEINSSAITGNISSQCHRNSPEIITFTCGRDSPIRTPSRNLTALRAMDLVMSPPRHRRQEAFRMSRFSGEKTFMPIQPAALHQRSHTLDPVLQPVSETCDTPVSTSTPPFSLRHRVLSMSLIRDEVPPPSVSPKLGKKRKVMLHRSVSDSGLSSIQRGFGSWLVLKVTMQHIKNISHKFIPVRHIYYYGDMSNNPCILSSVCL